MLTFIKRANQSTHYHMDKLIASLCDDGDVYTLVKTDGGYAIDWTNDDRQERGSVVKCSICGRIQDLWDGQHAICAECLQ